MEELDQGQFPVRKVALTPLQEAVKLAEAGDRAGARELFRRIVQQDMENEDAWLWLAWTAETQADSMRCLEEAMFHFPDSERIRDAMDWVREEGAKAPTPVDTVGASASHFSSAEPEPGVDWEPEPEPRRARRSAGQHAQTRLSGFSSGLASLMGRLSRMSRRRWDMSFVQNAAKPAAILLFFALLAGVVVMGVLHARSVPRVVNAIDLPPRDVNVTPTPSLENRTRDLWIDVEKNFTREDWDGAIDTLQRIREIDPSSESARAELGLACYYRAKEYIEANELDRAGVELDRAIRLNAESEDLQQTRRELHTYMDGLASLQSKAWPDAIVSFERVLGWNAGFRDVRLMLADAYYEHGLINRAAGDDLHASNQVQEASDAWVVADEAFERSLELNPDDKLAQAQSREIKEIITPPKRIEVDLSSKQCTLYENDQPIRTYVICTGRSSAPTLPGRYNIKTKMDSAYASKWDLDMPYWLGIYDAGGSENGFHALPILSSGVTLWRSALGTGCSFGCIVLDTDDARELYYWAELGDVVFVRY